MLCLSFEDNSRHVLVLLSIRSDLTSVVSAAPTPAAQLSRHGCSRQLLMMKCTTLLCELRIFQPFARIRRPGASRAVSFRGEPASGRALRAAHGCRLALFRRN